MTARRTHLLIPIGLHAARILLFSLFCLGLQAVRRTPASESASSVPAASRYDSTTDCRDCHARLPIETGLLQDNPAEVWDRQDKHRLAFSELLRQRGLVQRILGFDLHEIIVDDRLSQREADQRKVEAARACLRCHATWPVDEPEPPVELKFGVSCQACHGPGFDWSRPHREKWWRLCTPEAKQRLGMVNLRDPVRRTQLCVSCHIGDRAQDRFVTHAMYAAGHPPLPSFEFGAFREQMPAHWRPLAEKAGFPGRDSDAGIDRRDGFNERFQIRADDMRASYLLANQGHLPPHATRDVARTRDTVIGALVVLSEFTRMIGESNAELQSTAGAIPDFALFDCTGCHHELRFEAGRPVVDVRGIRPGRPALPLWPMALARQALELLPPDKSQGDRDGLEFVARWRELRTAVARRPFGSPAEVATAAEQLSRWTVQRIEESGRRSMSSVDTRRFLLSLTESDRDPAIVSDFASARQIAWAIREVAADLNWPLQQRQELFLTDESIDLLRLRLPSGQLQQIVEAVPDLLQAQRNYQASWFRDALQRTRGQLREGKREE